MLLAPQTACFNVCCSPIQSVIGRLFEFESLLDGEKYENLNQWSGWYGFTWTTGLSSRGIPIRCLRMVDDEAQNCCQ